jgi:N-acyl-D-amino-acid deacylase
VRDTILAPLDMHSTQLGRTRLEGRRPGEVRYYDPSRGPSVFAADLGEEVPNAYGAWNLEAMDSHGGWLSTAEDLARFGAAFDDPENCRVLKAESVRLMFSRPANDVYPSPETNSGEYYYGLGWLVRPRGEQGQVNTWHTGSLPGTATLLVRRHDGVNWVVLFNARQDRGVRHLTRTIDPLMHQAANAVAEWPSAAESR